jgi:hypothetical protein
MVQLISEIWAGLRDAGMPEVMLYLPDHSASRCHWDDTVEIGGIRVAIIADQERKIVRLLAVDSCTGIGVASPKGVDPSGYKATVQTKLNGHGPTVEAEPLVEEPAPVAAPPPPAPAYAPPPPEAPPSPVKSENPAARWGGIAIPPRNSSRFGNVSQPQSATR